MYFRVMMQEETARLEAEIERLKNVLSSHSEGFLQCSRNGNSYKWYRKLTIDSKERKYIPRSDRALAEQLAQNTYHYCRLCDLEEQLQALHEWPGFQKGSSRVEKLLSNPGFRELLPGSSQKLTDWKHAGYPKNPKHPEHLRIVTLTGEKVRSKSEAFIYNALLEKEIAFRYECLWSPDPSVRIYPDFMIRHPVTGQLIIWEHLGRLDKEEYRQEALWKLQAYFRHGFIPGVNLILTSESDEYPLGPQQVDAIIRMYLQ